MSKRFIRKRTPVRAVTLAALLLGALISAAAVELPGTINVGASG